MQTHLNVVSHISDFTPVCGNHRFSPGRDDPGFRLWAEREKSKVMDLFNDNDVLYLRFDDL